MENFLLFPDCEKTKLENIKTTSRSLKESVVSILSISTGTRPEKIQAPRGIRTHDFCDAGAVLSQLSYQSHTRAVVCGLAFMAVGILSKLGVFRFTNEEH